MTTRMSDETELYSLYDFLYDRDVEKLEDWQNKGVEFVELPSDAEKTTLCPLLTSLWERISLRVNERFARYFIAGETLEDWQRMLQVTTDSIALRYERMLRLYQEDTESDLFAGTRTIYDTLDANEGKTSGDSRYSDTPDTGVNDKGDYASSKNSTSGTSAYTDKRTGTVTQQVMGNGGVLSAINENSDAWRDIETRIVEEFRECFLSVIWY